uniref:Uncharacterized protein n=1 Tax=Solanum tuberosum TaxID=4113 RepID=M1DL68_SOLTU
MLVESGSPLKPLPKPSSENKLSLDPRSDHGPWSVSVDRGPLYPASDANDGRPVRTVVQSTVRRSDHRFKSSTVRSRIDRFPISSSAVPVHAHDHASRVSLGSLVILGPVSASRG